MCDNPKEADASTVYSALCDRLKLTDEISFKLLGFVPLVSGATFAVVLLKGEASFTPAVYYLSVLGALITLCLFGWELRNLKTCNYLVAWIKQFPGATYSQDNNAPYLIGGKLRIGKTEMEKVLYLVLTLSWLGLPYAACTVATSNASRCLRLHVLDAPEWWLVIAAFSILILLRFFFVSVEPPKTVTQTQKKEPVPSVVPEDTQVS